jgi:hypothetical protein
VSRRPAAIGALLAVLGACVLLARAGVDLPWLVLAGLCGVCGVAIAAHLDRR